jgi:hypothetical protein
MIYLQDVQANVAILIDIGVKARSGELYGRSRVWVVRRKLQRELVGQVFVDSPCASFDGANPFK